MSQHTPGPWHTVGLTIRDREARTIARMEYRYPEVANDARLIAAAPEMKALLNTLDRESESYDLNTEKGRFALAWAIAKLGHEIRALLAKIEGRDA